MKDNRFGLAESKAEGEPISYDGAGPAGEDTTAIDTTYVERRVPRELEAEAHELIDNWLRSKGFDPEEI